MSPKRIKQRLTDFQKALSRLREALAEDPQKTNTAVDGTIQRFEFTFELAWKLAQAVLHHNGIEANNPRAVVKEAFQAKVIPDGEGWIRMLDDRNRTAHIYDEAEARKIYRKIKNEYLACFSDFAVKMTEIVSKMDKETL